MSDIITYSFTDDGESEKTRVSMYTCAKRESPLINVIDDKCYDINKGLNTPLIAEGLGLGHYRYHLKGHTCACDFLVCHAIVGEEHFVYYSMSLICDIPANTRHSPDVDSTLCHRLRRWHNVEPTSDRCIVFAAI